MDCAIAWKNLESAVFELENGNGDWDIMAATAQAAIIMVFDYEPAEIVEQAQASSKPPKALARWLVYEGMKLADLDPARIKAFVEYWNSEMAPEHGNLVAPVKAA